MSGLWDLKISFQNHDRLKKAAGLFAGMNQMQPLLLATTNSHYLLDRFCMERCCSSEYISRIVTSIIFMEILATLLVACIGVGIANLQGTTGEDLNNWNEKKEWYRGPISTGIQFVIFLCYFQIFYAFTTGGKKGHMHWFYVSLMFQQFVCLLIGGAIGFWEAGVTLWYLMAIPVGPIPVFFYQLYIHSWIRNNGPSDIEYIVVEYQIWLAMCISFMATIFWAAGYLISYIPIELEIENLDSTPSSTDQTRITDGDGNAKTLALTNGHVTGNSENLGSTQVQAKVTLTKYSATLITVEDSGTKKVILTIKAGVKILFEPDETAGSVTVQSATKTGQPTLEYTSSSNLDKTKVYSTRPNVTVNKPSTSSEVTIALAIEEIKGTISTGSDITNVTVTIPVKIDAQPVETISSVLLKLPVPTESGTKNNLTINPIYSATNILTITVKASGNAGHTRSGSAATATVNEVSGTGFAPKKDCYCIYSVREGGDSSKDIWANISGKCEYAVCYKGASTGKTSALLILYILGGGSPNIRYFGTQDAGNEPWKTISEDEFITKLKELPSLADGQLSGLNGQNTDQYNREFDKVLFNPASWWNTPSATWFPLVMHGMAVGSFGSIFPNLIPKTLVCARTSRTLSVVSIFLSPVPHIINLALAENDLLSKIGVGDSWTDDSGWPNGWPFSYLLYIFYGLAFLFAIFNVHSPEWKLCCYIRSHGWMPLMMTLSITLIIEILIAIARAGIMMQRPANDKDKNHPLLWNKMACLLSLSYLPFWLTTTPMMKSYVSSLDPFLCDKDRDHWPTARFGAWRSGWYWCKCACRGLYNSPRRLVTLNMRKALTRKDPPLFYTLYGVLLMTTVGSLLL